MGVVGCAVGAAADGGPDLGWAALSSPALQYSKLWNKAQGLDAQGGCFALAAVEETTAVL